MPAPVSQSRSAIRTEFLPGLWIDSRRALWIPALRLLAVADLHWGYAESHRARGNLLPLWGDAEIGSQLRTLCEEYRPSEMLWLGDVVHAAEGAAQAEMYLRKSPVPVTVLAGNHDRHWIGRGAPTAVRERYFFHHGDALRRPPAECVEVIGHHHPAIEWSDGAGARVKLPALVSSPARIIMPAFSPWAAGTDARGLTEPGAVLWAVSSRRIFPVPAEQRVSA